MGKQRFAQVELVFDNPPDNRGFFTLTISRRIRISGSSHKFEREVKPNDLLSSTEAAKLLRVSVRHLYRLVEEGHLKHKKQKKHLWFVSKNVQQLAMKRGRQSGRVEAFAIN